MKQIICKTLIASALMGAALLPGCGVDTVPKARYPEPESAPETTAVAETTTAPVQTATTVTSEPAETATVTTEVSNAPPASLVLNSREQVEVYEDLTVGDLITETNAELTDPAARLDTSETGSKSVSVEFTIEGRGFVRELTYIVADTTPPVILNSGWEPYAKKGETFDLGKIVGYADNYDRAPALTYEGTVDSNTVGSYPITATVTDSSGNSTSFELTVLVLEEIPQPIDDNPRVEFADFVASHNYENVRFGIDVSQWQSSVDFTAVKEAGADFVLMRMGYCYSELTKDEYYDRNIEEASKAGLDVGVYFYTTDNTEEKVREHARWMIDQLGGKELDFPIVFDWEEFGRFQRYGMNIHDLNEYFEAFCDEVGKAGYTAMLYSSRNFLNNFWTNRGGHPVWLAHYVDETNYEGSFALWQGSAYGRISGIDGDVDMNVQFMDEPLD